MFSELKRASHWNSLLIQVSREWLTSIEFSHYLKAMLNPDGSRRLFTWLGSPPLPPEVPLPLKPEIIQYKLFLLGKSGVGKTSFINTLIGLLPAGSGRSDETLGIKIFTLYWPVYLEEGRLKSRAILLKLCIWDCGSRAMHQYAYMLPQCKVNAHASLLVFSLTDRKSWEDVPMLMSEAGPNTLKIMIGTRLDKIQSSEVRVEEVRQFERSYNIPLLFIGNRTSVKDTSSQSSSGAECTGFMLADGKQGLLDMSQFMTHLCEYLLNADPIISLQVTSIGSQI